MTKTQKREMLAILMKEMVKNPPELSEKGKRIVAEKVAEAKAISRFFLH